MCHGKEKVTAIIIATLQRQRTWGGGGGGKLEVVNGSNEERIR